MNRYFAFVGAVAFAAAQSTVTLAAPTGGVAVPRPPAAAAQHAAAPHAPAREASSNRDDFKVPFDVNVQPRSFPESQHFTLRSPAGFNPQTSLSPYKWYYWQSRPLNVLYPAMYGLTCAANNNFLNSTSEEQPSDFTLGSLVDGKSNMFSSPSHNPGLAMQNDPGATSPNPFTLQVGFSPSGCEAPSFTNF